MLVAAAVAVIALLTTQLPGEGVRGGPLARAFGIGLAVLIGLLVVAAFARRNGR